MKVYLAILAVFVTMAASPVGASTILTACVVNIECLVVDDGLASAAGSRSDENGSGSASAAVGGLGQIGPISAFATTNAGLDLTALAQVIAFATFQDNLWLELTYAGQPGSNALITFSYNGTLTGQSSGGPWQAEADVTVDVLAGDARRLGEASFSTLGGTTGSTSNTFFMFPTVDWEHVAGNQWLAIVPVSALLQVSSVSTNDSCLKGAGTCDVPGFATSTANFLHTLALTNIQLFDLFGNELFDFRVTNAEGVDYSAFLRQPPNPVPEPATLALLGSGLAAFLVKLRRRAGAKTRG